MHHYQQILKGYLEVHGYWVLFLGTFLEGEAILLMAGFLAFQGYLSLPGVIGTAWAGSFLGDQFYFYLGHYKGRQILKRFHAIARKFKEALHLIEKYGVFVAFVSRFTYGLRIVLPIILGVTTLPPRTFLWINLSSALTWALVFSCGGYLFGKSASVLLENSSRYEHYLMLALVGFIMSAWLVHVYHIRKLKRPVRERLARIRKIRAARKGIV